MKKLLLLAAGALMSASSFGATWAVVGAYTEPNWNFDASVKFTGEGDNLSCTIEYLTNDFKIVDIDDSSWAIQYGTATPIEVNTEYTLDGKNGGDDPANIKFAGMIQGVKNATVKWNPTTFVMEVVAEAGDVVTGYPVLYATGSFNGWTAPGEDASMQATEVDGVYTVTIDLGSAEKTEFKLAGAGWSNEIAGGVEIGYEPVAVTKGGGNLTTTLQGVQTLVFNYDEMTMNFVNEAGVNSINNDEVKVVYNLQGVRVNPENLSNGLYIINGKKVLVRK